MTLLTENSVEDSELHEDDDCTCEPELRQLGYLCEFCHHEFDKGEEADAINRMSEKTRRRCSALTSAKITKQWRRAIAKGRDLSRKSAPAVTSPLTSFEEMLASLESLMNSSVTNVDGDTEAPGL